MTTTEAEPAPLVLRGDFRLSVLGPVDFRHGATPVEVTGVARNLLAVLAGTPGEVLPVDTLATRLWGERPPDAAEKAVAAYVGRLRKAIATALPPVDPETVVVGMGAGYVLAIQPSTVDYVEFQRLASEGQRALSVGQFGLARQRLAAGLDLWRGTAYADLESHPYARTEATRLGLLRLSVIESRVDADLALAAPSAPEALADELRDLTGSHPHRERFWIQSVTTLHRLGRKADALAAFEQACAALIDDAGREPGLELRAAGRGLADGDPALDGHPLATAPVPEPISPRTPACVGREQELAWLEAALDAAAARRGQARLIVGTAGMGKTRLVAELAQRAARRGATVHYGQGPEVTGALEAAPDRLGLVIVDDLDQAGRDALARVVNFVRATAARPVLTVVTATDIVRTGELGALPKLVLTSLADAAIADVVRVYAPGTTEATAVTAMANASGVPGRLHRAASEWAFARAGRRIDRAVADAPEPQRWLAAVRDEVIAGVRDLEHVRAEARAALRPAARDASACPYRGLARFERGDAELMHGRERLIAELVARLVGASLLAVVGESGAGTSSLVRAGLLPALAAGVLPDSTTWRQAVTTPAAAGDLAARLPAAGEATTVLVVDHFEQVFTALGPAERETFVAGLVEAVRTGRATVVLTLDSAWYARCADLPALAALVTVNTVLVPPLTTDGWRRAVQRPAALAGLSIEDGLTDLILADMAATGSGPAPLSTALRLLWEHRDGQTLTVRAYRAFGGVAGAIGTLAEAAYAAVPAGDREAARRLLVRLAGAAAPPPARTPPVRLEAAEAAPIEAFVARGLVTVADGTAELIHPALVAHWPRMVTWLDEEAVGRQLRARLTADATAWATAGGAAQSGGSPKSGGSPTSSGAARSGGGLYEGQRLVVAQAWAYEHPGELSAVEGAFLAASEEALRLAEIRRANGLRRLRQIFAAVVLALAVVVAGGAVALTRAHRSAAAAVVADAQRLAAQALAEPDARQALLLAVAATRLDGSATTRGAVLSALARNPDLVAAAGVGEADRVTALSLSPDGSTLVLASRDGPIRLLDAATLRETRRLDLAGHPPVDGLAFTPDGRRLVSWGGPRAWTDPQTQPPSIVVWDLAAGAPAGPAFGEAHPVGGGGLLADGVTLVTGRQDATGRLTAVAWNIESRTPSTAYPLPSADVRGVTVSADGHRVITTTGSGSVVLDAVSGESRMLAGVPGGGVLSPDGTVLLTPDGADIAVWEAETGRRRGTARGGSGTVTAVVWTADGRSFGSARSDGGLAVWDEATLRVRRAFTAPAGVTALRFAPDGETLYSGGSTALLAWDLTGTRGPVARRSIVEGGSGVGAGPGPGQYAYLDPDGVRVVDTATGRAAGRPLPVGAPARLTTAGPYLAAVYPDGRATVWDLRSGQVVTGGAVAGGSAGGGSQPGWSVAVDAAGHHLAVGLRAPDGSGEVRVFDLASGAPAGNPVPVRQIGAGLTLSPDGRYLAIADGAGRIRVLGVGDGKEAVVLTVPPARGPLDGLAFSGDGRWLAAMDPAGVTALFDVDGWGPVWTATLPAAEGLALTGAPDGGTGPGLLALAAGGELLAWSGDPGAWIRRACALAGRDLTPSEWQRRLPDHPYRHVCPDA